MHNPHRLHWLQPFWGIGDGRNPALLSQHLNVNSHYTNPQPPKSIRRCCCLRLGGAGLRANFFCFSMVFHIPQKYKNRECEGMWKMYFLVVDFVHQPSEGLEVWKPEKSMKLPSPFHQGVSWLSEHFWFLSGSKEGLGPHHEEASPLLRREDLKKNEETISSHQLANISVCGKKCRWYWAKLLDPFSFIAPHFVKAPGMAWT